MATTTFKYFSFDQAGQFDEGELLCIQSDDGLHEPLPVALPVDGEEVSIPLDNKSKSLTGWVKGISKGRVKVSGTSSNVVWHIDVAVGLTR